MCGIGQRRDTTMYPATTNEVGTAISRLYSTFIIVLS
jgi:hypothetical protein